MFYAVSKTYAGLSLPVLILVILGIAALVIWIVRSLR